MQDSTVTEHVTPVLRQFVAVSYKCLDLYVIGYINNIHEWYYEKFSSDLNDIVEPGSKPIHSNAQFQGPMLGADVTDVVQSLERYRLE